jgi:hypothetical protein
MALQYALRAIVDGSCKLARVARLAQRLNVLDIVTSATRDRHDMIDRQLNVWLLSSAQQAAMIIVGLQRLPLCCGETTVVPTQPCIPRMVTCPQPPWVPISIIPRMNGRDTRMPLLVALLDFVVTARMSVAVALLVNCCLFRPAIPPATFALTCRPYLRVARTLYRRTFRVIRGLAWATFSPTATLCVRQWELSNWQSLLTALTSTLTFNGFGRFAATLVYAFRTCSHTLAGCSVLIPERLKRFSCVTTTTYLLSAHINTIPRSIKKAETARGWIF